MGERKKGKLNLFLSLRKGHGPTCIIFFSLFCLHFLSPLLMSYYLHSLSHTHHLHYSSFLFISHLHLSIFYLPISFYLNFSTQQTSLSRPEDRKEERETHAKSKREKEPVVLFKKFSCFYFQHSFFAFKFCTDIKKIYFLLEKQHPFAY